jgi:hypothetical protein
VRARSGLLPSSLRPLSSPTPVLLGLGGSGGEESAGGNAPSAPPPGSPRARLPLSITRVRSSSLKSGGRRDPPPSDAARSDAAEGGGARVPPSPGSALRARAQGFSAASLGLLGRVAAGARGGGGPPSASAGPTSLGADASAARGLLPLSRSLARPPEELGLSALEALPAPASPRGGADGPFAAAAGPAAAAAATASVPVPHARCAGEPASTSPSSMSPRASALLNSVTASLPARRAHERSVRSGGTDLSSSFTVGAAAVALSEGGPTPPPRPARGAPPELLMHADSDGGFGGVGVRGAASPMAAAGGDLASHTPGVRYVAGLALPGLMRLGVEDPLSQVRRL